MFEGRKFVKYYPLLVEFVIDENKRKSLAKDKNFLEYYKTNETKIKKIIEILKKIYPIEKVNDIVTKIIINQDICPVGVYAVNLIAFEKHCLEYNDNIDPLKNMPERLIINGGRIYLRGEIPKIVFNMCFDYYYGKLDNDLKIDDESVFDLFHNARDLEMKNFLYSALKNNRLEFFVNIMNSNPGYIDFARNVNRGIKGEQDLILFNPLLEEKLGKDVYVRLVYFFYKKDIFYNDDKERNQFLKLIELEKYELIKDILLAKRFDLIRNIDISESTSVFSSDKFTEEDIAYILENKISGKTKFNWDYYWPLKTTFGEEKYEEFYNKHKETIDLLLSVSKSYFLELDEEEQKKVYQYVSSLKEDELSKIRKEIEEINAEMVEMYKNGYVDTINGANSIIDKSVPTRVTDSKGDTHNVRVYELANEEQFTLLITVMKRNARILGTNMYGRPQHYVTIDNPVMFTQDLSGGSEIISTSMIDNTHVDTFVGPYVDLMYVFSDLESDDILGICPCDGGFPPSKQGKYELFPNGVLLTPADLMRKTKHNGSVNGNYNEIAINRKRKGKKILPTAILCFDKINDESIKHAEYFNIPIIVINTKTYKMLETFTNPLEKKGRGY
jgi:hypothetical protein